jgi:hypothetical protein
MFILRAEIVTIFEPKMIIISARNTRLYYIHFEINGVSCNLIGSQECDFSTNRTPSSAIRAEIRPSFNQSH